MSNFLKAKYKIIFILKVVPVPAIFTRGRWECRDFKEVASVENQILGFVEKQQLAAAVSAAATTAVIPIPVSQSIDNNNIPIAQKIVILPATNNAGINPALVATNTIYENGGISMNNNNMDNTSILTSANVVAIDNKIEQAMVRNFF